MFLVSTCLVLGLAACSTPLETPGQQVQLIEASVNVSKDMPPAPTSVPACCTRRDLERNADDFGLRKAAISQRTIYFAFDQYRVSDEYLPVIETHARYLLLNPKLVLRVAGNADQRGSREYNLALGQKRAYHVQRALLLYGVSEQRIETFSYGSEKPVATGSDEASWQLNRRVELSYAPQ
jgi:peptidoglycan-associated lipoprotein